MLAAIGRLLPASLRSFALAVGIVLIASMSTAGVGLASTDPNPVLPGSTPVNPMAEMCENAVANFNREFGWLIDHSHLDPDDPRVELHRDRMWDAWHFAEFHCRIDVNGDGEFG